MRREVVHSSDKITVWAYPDRGIVHHQMLAYCSGDPFRRALDAGIEAMRRIAGSKWLSDDRINHALAPDDLKWADEVWFPKTVAAGWKYWALVPPQSVIGQLNIKRHVRMYKERGVTVEVFAEPDAALWWLDGR
jgi:hypothetical protein